MLEWDSSCRTVGSSGLCWNEVIQAGRVVAVISVGRFLRAGMVVAVVSIGRIVHAGRVVAVVCVGRVVYAKQL